MDGDDMNTNPVFGSESPVLQPAVVAEDSAQDEPEDKQAVPGVEIVELYRPLTINGKVLTEIVLDFNKLSGIDMDNVEAEMLAVGAGGMKLNNPAFSNTYNLRIAARAAGINYRELVNLHIKDAIKVAVAVQNFLLV